jgi:hypothetical protein
MFTYQGRQKCSGSGSLKAGVVPGKARARICELHSCCADFSAVHPILVPGYHRLLLDVFQTSPGASTSSTTISPPLSILQSLFGLSINQRIDDVNELVVLAEQTMPLLFPLNSTSHKAEAWTEAWTAMISLVATIDAGVLNAAAQEALRQLAELVSKSTVTSLSGSQNRRKVWVKIDTADIRSLKPHSLHFHH